MDESLIGLIRSGVEPGKPLPEGAAGFILVDGGNIVYIGQGGQRINTSGYAGEVFLVTFNALISADGRVDGLFLPRPHVHSTPTTTTAPPGPTTTTTTTTTTTSTTTTTTTAAPTTTTTTTTTAAPSMRLDFSVPANSGYLPLF